MEITILGILKTQEDPQPPLSNLLYLEQEVVPDVLQSSSLIVLMSCIQ